MVKHLLVVCAVIAFAIHVFAQKTLAGSRSKNPQRFFMSRTAFSWVGPRPHGWRRWRLSPAPAGLVTHAQIWGLDAAPVVFHRGQEGVEGAAGEKSPFDIPGGLAREHHLFDAVEQAGEMHRRAAFLGPEQG